MKSGEAVLFHADFVRRYHLELDPNNPVVRLCAQGMELEGRGRLDEASQVFLNAWNESSHDFERCIAAHYVARHQKNSVDTLLWNQRSLDHANAVADERVRGFYPSLYLNMGKAHEDLGNREESKRFYEMAVTALDSLPEGRYGDIVREAVGRALLRLSGSSAVGRPAGGGEIGDLGKRATV